MAKIGCLKPFRGSWNGMKDIVLEDGEIAFITEGSKMIYFGNGIDKVENLTPFANIGGVDISSIGSGSITSAISTINGKISGDLSNYLKLDTDTTLTDLNNAPANSWIWFNSTMTHTPENMNAGFCITFKYLTYLGADYNVQLVFGGNMYFRTSVYGGIGVTAWSSWSKVTSTTVL